MAKSLVAVSLGVLAVAGRCGADVLDLTSVPFGFVNGARFERADFRPAGSGVINSFVRVSAANQPVVQGYNTSGRPVAFDENTSPQFTRDVTFGMIPSIVIDGTSYKEFFLDINQQAASPLLSLDRVQIYTSATGGQTNVHGRIAGDVRLRHRLRRGQLGQAGLPHGVGEWSGRHAAAGAGRGVWGRREGHVCLPVLPLWRESREQRWVRGMGDPGG